MINFRMLKVSDHVIWWTMFFLVIAGFAMIFSATFKASLLPNYDVLSYVKRQFSAFIIGLIGLSIFAYLDYRHLKKIAWPLYAIVLFLLVFVLFKGSTVSGAQRWIDLGLFSFQPSEITKLVVILALAAYFDKMKEKASIIMSLLIAGLPFILIFKQPDLGTALVILAIVLGMLVWNKTSPIMLAMVSTPVLSLILRPNLYLWIAYIIILWGLLYFSRVNTFDLCIIMGISIGVGIAFPIIWGMLKEYQRVRIISFINPGIDPQGAGYHTLQSIIAVGAGGFFGRGFLHGTQTQLHFIPEQHSDFIYSAVAEEFGFIGAMLVIIALVAMIRKMFLIADDAPDYFGSILTAGVAVMLMFHTLVSVGMVLGVMPVVGIPLPFVSFGGTSLIVNMILIGIVQSVTMRRQKLIF